jgi:hypothetical protein
MLTRPSLLLRIEELVLFAASLYAYAHMHFTWWLFAVLFLAPDLSMLGYVAGPRTGAASYNIGHFIVLPILLLAIGIFSHRPALIAVSLIWFGHITLDRALGYGFKYPSFFKDTHLQRIG